MMPDSDVAFRLSKWEWIKLYAANYWSRSREYFLRYYHAQHNARVIIDFENRMSVVLSEATGGLLSKSYYSADNMLTYIAQAQSRAWDDAYCEGRRDLASELGVDDPSPCEPTQ